MCCVMSVLIGMRERLYRAECTSCISLTSHLSLGTVRKDPKSDRVLPCSLPNGGCGGRNPASESFRRQPDTFRQNCLGLVARFIARIERKSEILAPCRN